MSDKVAYAKISNVYHLRNALLDSDVNSKRFIENGEEHFDYIVIGTGFCSYAFVSETLKLDPRCRILVLESGSLDYEQHLHNDVCTSQESVENLTNLSHTSRFLRDTPENATMTFKTTDSFGGKSLIWTCWCPRPTRQQAADWPEPLWRNADRCFPAAEHMLGVISTDLIDSQCDGKPDRPKFGEFQRVLMEQLKSRSGQITHADPDGLTYSHIAFGTDCIRGDKFNCFSTPEHFSNLLTTAGQGRLYFIDKCNVSRLIHDRGAVTEIVTSRGHLKVKQSKVILAIGNAKTAQLMLTSFPQLSHKIGSRVSGHFVDKLKARIPRADFPLADKFTDSEAGAFYVSGTSSSGKQFHVQICVIADKIPNSELFINRFVRIKPSLLENHENYVICICKVLGELDSSNAQNKFTLSNEEEVILDIKASALDKATHKDMMTCAREIVEKVSESQRFSGCGILD
jgi:hypothetical protein